MRRDRKPIAVDTIRSGGVDVEVFYNFHDHDFFFEKSGSRDRVTAKTFVEVLRLLNESYENATPLDWKPVILVTLGDAYDDQDHSVRTREIEGASIYLTFRRCELSPHPDHVEMVERFARDREVSERLGRHRNESPIERVGYIEREHVLDFEAGSPTEYDREVRAKSLSRADTYRNETGVVELPYEEDTWRGLLAMKAAIDELHVKVDALIHRADFRDRLTRFASGASLLLSDGSDGKDK